MMGIDKIFGGILDSIGLGALKPLVNTAFDFATGNLPGIIQDLSSLIGQFGDGGFANNLSRNQPLPDSFTDSTDNNYNSNATETERDADRCCSRDGNNDLSSNRLGELFSLLSDIFKGGDASEVQNKLSDLFKLLTENSNNRDTLQNARTSMQFFSGNLTISA